MRNWAEIIVKRTINVGTALVLMGAQWLYLWVFPWYGAYVADPHWGHNYAQSLAFLAVGLAYFNGRLISDVLALLASILIIPSALELLPHPVTAIAGGVLAALIILDMIVERGRKEDLGQPSNRRFSFWLKGHVLRFAYIMLGHLALIHFFVRLPGGTYETDLVTIVYNGMSLLFLTLAILDGALRGRWATRITRVGFFWGMLTMAVALIILSHQPETLVCLGITLVATVLAVAAIIVDRGSAKDTA
jgi:hypothetical protein